MYAYPLSNTVIAEHLDVLSKLMDIFGENSFKIKTYSSAAYTVKKLPQSIAEMDEATFNNLKVVGDSVKQKIAELLNTGSIAVLDEYKSKTPEGVLEMMRIKGLGPKKIAELWKELDITSIGELEYACQENRLMTFKGFGQKTQQDILEKIQFLKHSQGLFLWKEVDDLWKALAAELGEDNIKDVCVVGDYARQLPVVPQLELLTSDAKVVLESIFVKLGFEIISNNDNCLKAKSLQQLPIEVTFVERSVLGLQQLKQSSAPEFYAHLQDNFTLPENAENEQSVFKAVKVNFVPAYLREAQNIVLLTQQNLTQDIITTESIKGIIHSHSTWSDGMNTLEEMAKAAQAMGMEYLVISDHSKSAFYANGLSVERIKQQHKEIDELNQQLAPFKIFKSIEADILNDGSLDYEDEVLALFDLVIASVHSNLNMNEGNAMHRLLTAVANPYTTILGHPTGRLLLSRAGYPVNAEALIDACKEHNVVIEINAHPRRLDLDWQYVALAQTKGVKLSINPDAHAVAHLDLIQYGVATAQKANLKIYNNLSSYSLAAFEAYLKDTKAKKGIKEKK
jgi:DNA polymerase (family 10)